MVPYLLAFMRGRFLKTGRPPTPTGVPHASKTCARRAASQVLFLCVSVDDGLHNVSRWMTWLPISLKNAAKCDKWYQLQNLSITESLNANGSWKKAPVVQLQECHVSVSNKNQKPQVALWCVSQHSTTRNTGKRQILCLARATLSHS